MYLTPNCRQLWGQVVAEHHRKLRTHSVENVRAEIRAGRYQSHTAGLGQGFLQTNLVILPITYALDFMRFCQRNPKPCPLVGVSDTGNPMMFTLGSDIDIRTDLPAYNVYRNVQISESVTDIRPLWTDDMVAFALGCSFTFEKALGEAGIPLWHVENDSTVPMFRSNIATTAAGPFTGPMVVSMSSIARDRVRDATVISARFPLAPGAPVHIGDPTKIGIADVSRPDWGDPAPVTDGQVTAFWACGVTPQAAIEAAQVPLCITHKPGCMLITDIPEDAEVPVLQTKKDNIQQGVDP